MRISLSSLFLGLMMVIGMAAGFLGSSFDGVGGVSYAA